MANAPPPQYNAPPPQHQGPPQTQVVMQAALGSQSTRITCPNCHTSAFSRTEKVVTGKTHLIAVILFCFTLCCCFIPYVTDCCKATHHFCPNCGTFLGAHDM